jgi:hypothetical protein
MNIALVNLIFLCHFFVTANRFCSRLVRFVKIQKMPNLLEELVPGEGIEPPAFGLQNRCSKKSKSWSRM